ncbi:DUF1697 domain-containing protein [Spongisporangium articulatum]|uniref:DUF1697 domain-containing protein n=1 Tax=Spongisporangium articulatum TaxID=3362603 RepID=A0ABW8AUT1_9ACTN
MAGRERYALLLRGVNVGGVKLSMKDFRAALETDGLDDVATYLQSGQAVVTASGTPAALQKRVEKLIKSEFGLDIRVLAQTHAQLEAVVADCPYPRPEAEPTKHVVWWLIDALDAAGRKRLAEFDQAQFAPDEFALVDDRIYLRLPDGQGRSKLLPPLQRALKVPATARNWNTVVKLVEMTAP